RRPGVRDSTPHRSRGTTGQALRHPDLHPQLRLRGCRHTARQLGRTRHLLGQADRHAGRAGTYRRRLRPTSGNPLHRPRTICRSQCALSRRPCGHEMQPRHEGLLSPPHRKRQTAKACHHRCRPKARCARQYPHHRRPKLATSAPKTCLTQNTDANPPPRKGGGNRKRRGSSKLKFNCTTSIRWLSPAPRERLPHHNLGPCPMPPTARPTALITGASSGIGLELARQLAARNHDLVLTARSAGKLHELAAELTRRHGIQTHVLAEDLLDPSAPARIRDHLAHAGIAIDILVNNAGFGLAGPFASLPIERQMGILQVNVMALTNLTGLLLPGLLSRPAARIL